MKTDEGYELIRQLIDSRAQQDPKIRSVQELIADGEADFKDTSEYSRRSSEILGTSLSEHILELDDEAREDVCKKLLHDGYEDINDVLAEVQTSLDEKTGVNIRPKKPPFQTERVATFAHSLADHTVADHVIKRRAKNGAANISMSDHDRYMKENAKLRHNAGLKCYIERDTDGGCCEWCSKMAGSYIYGEEPKDVYRRHDNCGCSVTYKNGKQRQNVWSKKTWEADKDERISKAAGKEPTVFGKAEAQAKQSELIGYNIKSSSEIKFSRVNSSPDVDKKFLQEYRKDYDNFTSIFGQLPILSGFNVKQYTGGTTFGAYNPYSREITLIGVGGKSGRGFITQVATNEKKKGQWSTSSPYHSFRHELGHALQAQLKSDDPEWNNKFKEVETIFNGLNEQLTKLEESDIITFKKTKLSIYGFDSVEEFISESVAEYANSPKKCRSTAKQVVSILLRKRS